jgi:hypothetical protein
MGLAIRNHPTSRPSHPTIPATLTVSPDPASDLKAASQMNVRTPAEIEALFARVELIEPGLVNVQEWSMDQPATTSQGVVIAGVARIP